MLNFHLAIPCLAHTPYPETNSVSKPIKSTLFFILVWGKGKGKEGVGRQRSEDKEA